MGMKMDFADFDRGFETLVKESAPADLAKGMFTAGNAVLKDSIYEKPYAPFDEGHLRGSARVDDPKVTSDEITGVVGFNIEYAARWHELTPEEDARINWTLPGSGRKYMESKMARNAKRYLAIIGEFLKRRLGG